MLYGFFSAVRKRKLFPFFFFSKYEVQESHVIMETQDACFRDIKYYWGHRNIMTVDATDITNQNNIFFNIWHFTAQFSNRLQATQPTQGEILSYLSH